ncbi:hypothetical protein [Streptomyces sp. NPDC047000]|uniref:hypothetical protein n=1 Tax=Streptomyces sp. NPDC047000 TaxID=3155474 RepID=UPI0033E149CB
MRRTGIAAGALAFIGGVAQGDAGDDRQASGAGTIPAQPITQARGAATGPPWAAPADPSARADAAGPALLGSEGRALHIHSHFDVVVDGEP